MAISMEEVVRVLQNRIGMRYEGIEADGRDEMVRALKKEFNLGGAEADDIIDGLIRAGTIRYEVRDGEGVAENAVGAEVPPIIPAPMLGTGGSGMAAPAIPLAPAAGHWRIGNEEDAGV